MTSSMDSGEETCPDCGGQMVVRYNRQTGAAFWGCRDYPDCSGTRAFGGADLHETKTAAPSERARRNDSRRWERE